MTTLNDLHNEIKNIKSAMHLLHAGAVLTDDEVKSIVQFYLDVTEYVLANEKKV